MYFLIKAIHPLYRAADMSPYQFARYNSSIVHLFVTQHKCVGCYTEKTIFPFPFTLNGIWSWWQFSFRFSEPSEIAFCSKSKGKLSPRLYPIQYERKWKNSFLSVYQFARNDSSIVDLFATQHKRVGCSVGASLIHRSVCMRCNQNWSFTNTYA